MHTLRVPYASTHIDANHVSQAVFRSQLLPFVSISQYHSRINGHRQPSGSDTAVAIVVPKSMRGGAPLESGVMESSELLMRPGAHR